MKHWFNRRWTGTVLLVFGSLFLSGCASFTGIRTPLYDGNPVQTDEEAIELYSQTYQLAEGYEEAYLRYPLSSTLFEPSLLFSDNESVILEEGNYTVGEDLEAGRVFLQGEPSDFRQEVWIIHTANVTVYDEEGHVVFENHFQDGNGVMQAVVDFQEGYTIDVTGNDPMITVNYEEPVLEDDFHLEEGNTVLIAGHFEVGEHLEAGIYTLEGLSAPRATELYHFTNEGETTVIELPQRMSFGGPMTQEENDELFEWGIISETEYEMNNRMIANQSESQPVIELADGEKLYIPMIHQLILTKQE